MPHDVSALLLEAGDKYPDNVALRKGSTSLTYREMCSAITTIGANLQARGVRQGDRFLFSVTPDPDGILLALGIMTAGGAVVLTDPRTEPDIVESRVRITAPKYAVAESRLYLSSSPVLGSMSRHRDATSNDYRKLPVRHFFTGKRLPGTPLSAVSTRKLLRGTSSALEQTDPTGEAVIAFTSEKSGHPRAVVHSRASLGSGTLAYADLCSVTETSHVFTDHFMFGLSALVCGGQWELPETTLEANPMEWVNTLFSRAATHTFMLPADSVLMLNEIDRRGGMRGGTPPKILAMAAARMLPPLITKIKGTIPQTKVLAVSGMTEVIPAAVVEKAGEIAYVNGDLAGGVILGAAPRIDNLEDGEGMEIVLSGDGLALDRPEGDKERSKHKKDLLIRQGKSIYPALYETGIAKIGGISKCVLVGIPDKRGDDVIILVVVPESAEQNSRRLKRKIEAHLPYVMDSDALPDMVVVRDSIPVVVNTGNPNRIQLRKDISSHPDIVHLMKERSKAT